MFKRFIIYVSVFALLLGSVSTPLYVLAQTDSAGDSATTTTDTGTGSTTDDSHGDTGTGSTVDDGSDDDRGEDVIEDDSIDNEDIIDDDTKSSDNGGVTAEDDWREETVAGSGEECGGPDKIYCIDGYECNMESDAEDASGKCIKEIDTDGTETPVRDAIRDRIKEHFKDIIEDRFDESLAGPGEVCGGTAGTECRRPLQCRLDGDHSDAEGTCVHPLIPDYKPRHGVLVFVAWGNFGGWKGNIGSSGEDGVDNAMSSLVAVDGTTNIGSSGEDGVAADESSESDNIGSSGEDGVDNIGSSGEDGVDNIGSSGEDGVSVDPDTGHGRLLHFAGPIEVNGAKLRGAHPFLFEKNQDHIKRDKENGTVYVDTWAAPHIDGVVLGLSGEDLEGLSNASVSADLGVVDGKATLGELREMDGPKIFPVGDTGLELRMRIITAEHFKEWLKRIRNHHRLSDVVSDDKYKACLHRLSENLSEDRLEALREKFGDNPEGLVRFCKHLHKLHDRFFEDLSLRKKNVVGSILEHRADILDQHDELGDKIDTLRDRLQNLKKFGELVDAHKRLLKHNFHGRSAEEAEALLKKVASILENATDDDIENFRNRLGEIIKNAREEKFRAGILRFRDVDDDEDSWYHNFVEEAARRGIVKGFSDASGNPLGEFRPGNNVTNSEALKMAILAILGEISDGKAVGDRVRDHWASRFWKLVEDKKLHFAKHLLNPDRSATRGDIIRLILELSGINPPAPVKRCFRDLALDHPNAAFICYAANELRIIAGDSGTEDSTGLTTFREGDRINRAEVAKIINLLLELRDSSTAIDEDIFVDGFESGDTTLWGE